MQLRLPIGQPFPASLDAQTIYPLHSVAAPQLQCTKTRIAPQPTPPHVVLSSTNRPCRLQSATQILHDKKWSCAPAHPIAATECCHPSTRCSRCVLVNAGQHPKGGHDGAWPSREKAWVYVTSHACTATTKRGPPDYPKTCAQNAHKFRRMGRKTSQGNPIHRTTIQLLCALASVSRTK